MDTNENANSTVLQEDLELFRRVMRVMYALQKQTAYNRSQLRAPSPTIRLQPDFTSGLPSGRPDMTDAMEGGHELADEDDDDDDDDESDDDDEEEEEDDDEEDDDDDEEEEDDDNDDDDDEEEEEDDDDDDDDDFFEDEGTENYQCGENDNGTSYREELQLPKDPIDDLSYQRRQHILPPTHVPFPASAIEGTQAMGPDGGDHDDDDDAGLRCWDHGCNGRKFTTLSNLKRHLRENSSERPTCRCPQCGAVFSRTTARNTHVARGSCNRIRRYSNGRIRPNFQIKNS